MYISTYTNSFVNTTFSPEEKEGKLNNLISYFQLTLISKYLLTEEWDPFQVACK